MGERTQGYLKDYWKEVSRSAWWAARHFESHVWWEIGKLMTLLLVALVAPSVAAVAGDPRAGLEVLAVEIALIILWYLLIVTPPRLHRAAVLKAREAAEENANLHAELARRPKREESAPAAAQPLAREDSVELFRQVFFNHFLPAIDCAGSCLRKIIALARSEHGTAPAMAALLDEFILERFSQERDIFSRAAGAALPGKLSLLAFGELQANFETLTWRYNSVVKWIRITSGDILGVQWIESAEYRELYSRHKKFVDELRDIKIRNDLKRTTSYLETIEQQLAAPPPANPPSPTVSE
ncbi:MAG TPA: hypothetical protein VKY89_03850 [Thermoanaerobaculia bacterium]|nr:hypothetical protein [Thermoanaerobaculia bacterium]